MDTNFTRLGYIAESTFGTTPSSAVTLIKRVSGTIQPRQSTVTSEEIRSDLRASKPIRTAQWAQGDVNIEWSYGTYDTLLEGLLGGTWTTNVLVDGTTKRSFTFEDSFIDTNISPDIYMIYKGCRMASMNFSLALGAPVRGSFSVLGATPSIATATVGNGTHTAVNTNPIWNCTDMVSDIEEGTALGTNVTRITAMEINLTRALRLNQQIGSLNPFDVGTGRLMISGTLTQYFESVSLMTAYLAFQRRALMVQFTDELTNILKIEMPKVHYVGDPNVEISGPDGDCMVTLNFEAYGDVGDAYSIRFTRTPT